MDASAGDQLGQSTPPVVSSLVAQPVPANVPAQQASPASPAPNLTPEPEATDQFDMAIKCTDMLHGVVSETNGGEEFIGLSCHQSQDQASSRLEDINELAAQEDLVRQEDLQYHPKVSGGSKDQEAASALVTCEPVNGKREISDFQKDLSPSEVNNTTSGDSFHKKSSTQVSTGSEDLESQVVSEAFSKECGLKRDPCQETPYRTLVQNGNDSSENSVTLSKTCVDESLQLASNLLGKLQEEHSKRLDEQEALTEPHDRSDGSDSGLGSESAEALSSNSADELCSGATSDTETFFAENQSEKNCSASEEGEILIGVSFPTSSKIFDQNTYCIDTNETVTDCDLLPVSVDQSFTSKNFNGDAAVTSGECQPPASKVLSASIKGLNSDEQSAVIEEAAVVCGSLTDSEQLCLNDSQSNVFENVSYSDLQSPNGQLNKPIDSPYLDNVKGCAGGQDQSKCSDSIRNSALLVYESTFKNEVDLTLQNQDLVDSNLDNSKVLKDLKNSSAHADVDVNFQPVQNRFVCDGLDLGTGEKNASEDSQISTSFIGPSIDLEMRSECISESEPLSDDNIPTFDDLRTPPGETDCKVSLDEAVEDDDVPLQTPTVTLAPNLADFSLKSGVQQESASTMVCQSGDSVDLGLSDQEKTEQLTAESSSCEGLASSSGTVPDLDDNALRKSTLKRPASSSCEGETQAKRKKSIVFDSVSVYYFPRTQGFTCVPSQV